MISTSILVKTVDDKTPAVKDAHNFIGESGLESMVILEKGLASGKTSVAFIVRLPDGKYTIAQTSAAMFNGMASALKGAEGRFADGPIEAPQSIEEVINTLIVMNKPDTNQISDGYHTFGELYEHRIALFIALCKQLEESDAMVYVWRSKRHSDGELAFGGNWFVLGIDTDAGRQITYHLPMSHWGQTNFAEVRDKAPEFDGHTPADVLSRLQKL